MSYTKSFKAQMVRKMLGPQSVSATALSSTAGVSQSTLSRWARTAGSLAAMAHKKTTKTASPRRPDDWPLLEKLAVVVAASEIPIDGLGAFLREKGVTAEQLETWRESAARALAPQRGRSLPRGESRRIKELERELARKEKALAEVAALLVLKKKADAIWGAEDDSTDERKGR